MPKLSAAEQQLADFQREKADLETLIAKKQERLAVVNGLIASLTSTPASPDKVAAASVN